MNHELLKGLALGMALANRGCLGKLLQVDRLAFSHGEDAVSLLDALGGRESVVAWLDAHKINCGPEQAAVDAILDYLKIVGIKMRGIKNAQEALSKAREEAYS